MNGRRVETMGWALAIVIAGVMPTFAQQAPLRLSLSEAIARSLETSHRLGELQARHEASEAQVQGARAPGFPQIALLGGYTRTNHVTPFGILRPDGLQIVYPDIPDNWRSRLDVQWPVYTGGRIEALVDAARSDATAAARDVDAARTDLRLETAAAYWGLVTAREAVTVVEAALQRVDAYLSDARARFDAGFVPPNDVSSAEAQRSLQQALLIQARNAVRQASLALARFIGVSPAIAIEPVEPLGPDGVPLAEADALVVEARTSRSDRQAIVSRIEAAEARRLAAGGGARPAIVAAGGVDYGSPNTRFFPRTDDWQESWDVSLNASWSLFDGGRVRAEVAAADASERALRQRLQELDTVLEMEVRQRWFEVESSRARAVAAADAVRSAADARRVLQDRYNAGVATSTEVLDAQVTLLDAELQRTRALAAARLAEASLERAIGR